MPKRLVAQTVILQREGVSVKPPVGAPYDFSADEIKQIERLNPEALQKIISKETTVDGEETVTLTQTQLDQQIQAALEKDRGLMEKQLREQIQAEQKAGADTATPVEKTTVKKVNKSGSTDDVQKAGTDEEL